jgi:ADP-ribose pyrophosphatase YjhB (NUDIX family)
VPQQFRPAIEKGIIEAAKSGAIAGYPLVDFKVQLVDGSFHPVDSDEHSFRAAGRKAFRAAMEKVKPSLLEPVMDVEIAAPQEYAGDIKGDLNSRRGRVQGMETSGKQQVIKAQVPMAEMLNYCSRCGAELSFGPIEGEDRDRLGCPSCGHIAYVNPRLVVTTIPVTDAGEIVLLRRGIDPGRGWWAQPGGFLEVDETVGEAAVRETLEETGLVVEPGEIVGLYSRLEAAVVVLAYEARVVGGSPRLNPEALEIQSFAPEAIPWPGIAFKTSYWAIRDWLHRRRPDIHPADRHWDE